MKSLLISGSCVSRDIFNILEGVKGGDIELLEYFARSSMASAFCESAVAAHIDLKKITSNFQRRNVAYDLEKKLASFLRLSSFDLLLIDFIDERFDLYVFDDGSICTLSNEFLSTGFDKFSSEGRVVRSGSEEFFQLWEHGWERLVSLLKECRLLERVRLNRVFWASRTESGTEFGGVFSAETIARQNDFLRQLYDRASLDLQPSQFLIFDQSVFVGSESHRWGISPFHYTDTYYKLALSLLLAETAAFLSDRNIVEFHKYDTLNPDKVDSNFRSLNKSAFSGNCRVTQLNSVVEACFEGAAGTYQLKYSLSESMLGNGVSAKFKLRGWRDIRYLALGYTHDGVFRHVKISNAAQDQWTDFSIGHRDLMFGLQNNWVVPDDALIADVRLYIKGEPEPAGAWLDVEYLACWQERAELPAWLSWKPGPEGVADSPAVSPALLDVVYGYLKKCFRTAEQQAKQFMLQGDCPLYGETILSWSIEKPLPDQLDSVGTYRFSWHGLHPASILMVHARDSGSLAPLFAAREFVSNWLDRSYYQNDADKKFAWYDHGTAERLLALVLMWAAGREHGFDCRFMNRLRTTIFRHAQLLESEAFYASHQPTRYHNHAWFQDLALLATSLAFPDFPCASRWTQRSLERLSDQLSVLIRRDHGYAVFVENSIGYHQGVQRLVEFAGELVSLTGQQSPIPDIAMELSHFSGFLRYPDNRAPAQGDTFRRANASGAGIRRIKAYPTPTCTILPDAGYAIVKGNHMSVPWMLTLFATSLCRTHKHEDNLSFTLFFDGLEWLIDPSFYSHEYAAPIPAYLRSAFAHNALVVEGVPYSIDPGHTELSGNVDGEEFLISGAHSAYAGVRIHRKITGRLEKLELGFEDAGFFDEGEQKDMCLMLHCGEGVRADIQDSILRLSHDDSRFVLHIKLPTDSCTIYSGVVEGAFVRGVSGLGFMQHSEIVTIACKVPAGQPLKWQLTADVEQ